MQAAADLKVRLEQAEPYGAWNPMSISYFVTGLCMMGYYVFMWLGAVGYYFTTTSWFLWLGGAMGAIALTNFVLCMVYSTCSRVAFSRGRNVYDAKFYSAYCAASAFCLSVVVTQVAFFIILYTSYTEKVEPSDFASPTCDALCQFYNSSRSYLRSQIAICAILVTLPMFTYLFVTLTPNASDRPLTSEFVEAVRSGELARTQAPALHPTAGVRHRQGASYRRVSPIVYDDAAIDDANTSD